MDDYFISVEYTRKEENFSIGLIVQNKLYENIDSLPETRRQCEKGLMERTTWQEIERLVVSSLQDDRTKIPLKKYLALSSAPKIDYPNLKNKTKRNKKNYPILKEL